MKLLALITTILLLATLSYNPSVAQANYNRMLPLPSELLPNPVKVEGCPITVTEWRASKGKPHTGPSDDSFLILSIVCKRVLKDFPTFVKKEGLKMLKPEAVFHEKFAFMPWIDYEDGMDYRNLNDLKDRFRKRTRFYNIYGDLVPILGYSDRNENYVFMMNNAFHSDGKKPNKKFAIVFAHEMFHAMSDQYKIYHTLGPAKDTVDEQLARKFTVFIGLGE